jgi:hypothetical protein
MILINRNFNAETQTTNLTENQPALILIFAVRQLCFILRLLVFTKKNTQTWSQPRSVWKMHMHTRIAHLRPMVWMENRITMCTLSDLSYVNFLVNRKAVWQKKRMFMSLVIPLSAGFTTNMRQLRGATDNLSGTNLKQIQTNICTHISCIQLSRHTVRGNNTAEKTTKYHV